MYTAYAQEDTLTYTNAIRVLCGLGVGKRMKQAEAVFNICDEDRGGLVSRAEFLKFIASSLPEDTSQHKSETFSKVSADVPACMSLIKRIQVGKLFLLLDEDNSGECTKEEFVDGVAKSDYIYKAFCEMSPYRQFFHHWNTNDMSLQNLLTAGYFSADPAEHHASIRDRVLILADRVDEDGSGRIEFEECLCLVEGMGIEDDDAERVARQMCGSKGMKKKHFVDMFVELAESNLKKFQFVERSYGLGTKAGSGYPGSVPSTRPSTRQTLSIFANDDEFQSRGQSRRGSVDSSRPNIDITQL